LLELFVNSGQTSLAEIERAASASDMLAISKAAHRLKAQRITLLRSAVTACTRLKPQHAPGTGIAPSWCAVRSELAAATDFIWNDMK